LQCLMLDRALELRHRSPQVPILPSQMPFLSISSGADLHAYEMSEREQAREAQCVDPYKANPELGMAAKPH
jgi:hypothetical protein